MIYNKTPLKIETRILSINDEFVNEWFKLNPFLNLDMINHNNQYNIIDDQYGFMTHKCPQKPLRYCIDYSDTNKEWIIYDGTTSTMISDIKYCPYCRRKL